MVLLKQYSLQDPRENKCHLFSLTNVAQLNKRRKP